MDMGFVNDPEVNALLKSVRQSVETYNKVFAKNCKASLKKQEDDMMMGDDE